MELRGGIPDDAAGRDADAARPAQAAADPHGMPGRPAWRVRPALAWFKAAGTVLLVLVAVASIGDRAQVFIALFGALVAGAFALRDFLVPVRLAATPDGVTVVTGYARRRHLPWSQIERVRVDERDRLGVKSRMLEVDAGDSLHLFTRYDLDADPDDVLAELEAIRPATGA